MVASLAWTSSLRVVTSVSREATLAWSVEMVAVNSWMWVPSSTEVESWGDGVLSLAPAPPSPDVFLGALYSLH